MKKQYKFGKAVLTVAAIIGLAGAFAGTAQADEWHGHGHGYGHARYEHEWREHHRYVEYRPYYYVVHDEPVVYYKPAPVFYQPAPVFYSPPPSGFNIVIPLTIK